MVNSEIIEFNGVKFRRYPDAAQRSDRAYFTPGIADRQRGVGRLHEEIWKAANGPIPTGFHIHHIDGDPLNNSVANLECMARDEHMTHHHAGVCSDRKLAHLEAIRPLTKAWHGSDEGLEWHRQHAYTTIRAIEPCLHTCDHCGAEFMAVPKKPNRFCSNACKSAWRRASGLDNEVRVCVVCGVSFEVNRYAKKASCSRLCAGQLISRARTSTP